MNIFVLQEGAMSITWGVAEALLVTLAPTLVRSQLLLVLIRAVDHAMRAILMRQFVRLLIMTVKMVTEKECITA